MANDLTPRQSAFVDAYLVVKNATAAYKMAYTAKNDNVAAVEGHKLLRRPKIMAAIADAQKDRARRTRIDQDWVVRRLAREARGKGPDTRASARVAALKLLGEHVGMWKDRAPLEELLAALANVDPGSADGLRQALGGHLSNGASASGIAGSPPAP